MAELELALSSAAPSMESPLDVQTDESTQRPEQPTMGNPPASKKASSRRHRSLASAEIIAAGQNGADGQKEESMWNKMLASAAPDTSTVTEKYMLVLGASMASVSTNCQAQEDECID